MDADSEGYIVEFIAMGTSVKVTAFDPATLREVSIVGSTRASQQHLAEIAIRKLKYVLAREQND